MHESQEGIEERLTKCGKICQATKMPKSEKAGLEKNPLTASATRSANSAAPPPGCYFHPRCPFAAEPCRTERPVLREIGAGPLVRCHRAEELTLAGA